MMKENCKNCKHLGVFKKEKGFWKWHTMCTALISEEGGHYTEVDDPENECCELWQQKE